MSSEGIDLSIQRSLELLEALKRTTSDFSQKEAQLTRELALRRNAAIRKLREGKELLESNYSTQRATANAASDSEAARVTEHVERRIARFQQVAKDAFRKLPVQAQAAKQRWMGDLQMQHFFAGRKKTEELALADDALASATASLAELRVTLARLLTHARRAFRGYYSFKRMLQHARLLRD